VKWPDRLSRPFDSGTVELLAVELVGWLERFVRESGV
jgi:hypothetical protein